jgi:uncharacterized BrkB/YihY/UPF0761 family membrane protein
MVTLPFSWTELLTHDQRVHGRQLLGLAAQLAYYLLLALVPALVFLNALTSFFPHRLEQMIASVGSVAPAEMTALLRTQMEAIAAGEHGASVRRLTGEM